MNNNSRDPELEKRMDAYIKGKLNEEEALQLWEQLLKRPDYIELLETELGVKSIIEKRSSDKTSGNSASAERTIIYSLQRSRNWLATAAAVTLLVIAVNVLQMETNQQVDDLALGEINVAENLSSAPILRNQKSDITPGDSLLNVGFQNALSGDITKALQVYDQIIENHAEESAAIQAYLNKGIIQYNTGQYGESITSFKAVLENTGDDPIVTEKAYWYLGNALINIEKLSEARNAIHKVYSMDGIYRKSAFRLLRKLDYKLGNIDFDDFEQQMNED